MQAVRALEALVGRYPAAAIAAPARLAPWPGDVPVGLPSELMERRPDVVAAERRVAGAFYRTEEAKAARLPRITLTANLTSISSELFVLKSTDNPLISFGASLLQPVFLGGQLQAQVEVRTAEQKQAVADYARVSLRAFSEVEDALSNGFALADRETIIMTRDPRERAGPRACQRAVSRGLGRPSGRTAAATRALRSTGVAAARAGGAARAARQPSSRPRRQLRQRWAADRRHRAVIDKPRCLEVKGSFLHRVSSLCPARDAVAACRSRRCPQVSRHDCYVCPAVRAHGAIVLPPSLRASRQRLRARSTEGARKGAHRRHGANGAARRRAGHGRLRRANAKRAGRQHPGARIRAGSTSACTPKAPSSRTAR